MRPATRTLIPREKTNEFLADAVMGFLDGDPGPAGQQWRDCMAQIDAACAADEDPDDIDAPATPARQRRSA